MKKTIAFIISIMMVFTMTPMIAFAETDFDEGAKATNSEVQEEKTIETPANEVDTVDEMLEVQSEIISAQEEELDFGQFKPTGDPYTMGDTSKYSKTMHIYAFYLGNGGEYGDAVLIESNGEYLLMDTGHKNSGARLVSCLKSVMGSNKKLNVYISHMHGDHAGGLEAVCTNFEVDTLFLPDIEVCKNYNTPNSKETIDQIYYKHVQTIEAVRPSIKIVYLRPNSSVRGTTPRATNTYSQFNVGGVTCDVIGPLGTYTPGEFEGYVKELNGHCGTKEGHCLNNSSLCTMMTCGSAKYLATGDVEKFEEANLVNRYGGGLNSDIMKMPHHGLRTSCSSVFGANVTPTWSFALNHGFSSFNRSGINVARSYGYCYEVGSSARTIGYEVSNGAIRQFIDYNDNGIMDDGLVTGWINTGKGYQYYNGAGYICTGWNVVGTDTYYMSGGTGFRITGTHKINGVKCKFNSSGQLVNPTKPAKAKMRSAKAKKGQRIVVKWKKASRASGYLVYRSTYKSGGYVCIASFGGKKRSMTDTGLVKGQKYYYKVRAVRYVAGGTLLGSASSAKKAKAK